MRFQDAKMISKRRGMNECGIGVMGVLTRGNLLLYSKNQKY